MAKARGPQSGSLVDVLVFGPRLLDLGQLSALASNRNAHRAHAPGFPALLQRGVVEFAAPAQDKRQRPFLLGSGLEFVFECFAHSKLFHVTLFCLAGTKPARREVHSSPGSRRGACWPISVSAPSVMAARGSAARSRSQSAGDSQCGSRSSSAANRARACSISAEGWGMSLAGGGSWVISRLHPRGPHLLLSCR